MARTSARIGLWLALVSPLFAGCSLTPINRDRNPPPANLQNVKPPDAPALVDYLNQNAQRVQSVRAKVAMTAQQGKQPVSLNGHLACQKPRDFRLKVNMMGSPAADIGSNNDEFWYWFSKAPDPYVFHCAYSEMATAKAQMPFPFHPDMVVAALGIAEYDPTAKYELRDGKEIVELIQDAKTPAGESVKRITVFRKYMAEKGQPQVLGHALVDAKGKMICKATVQKITVDRATGAVIPTTVTIEWPAEEMSMKLFLSDVQTNALDKTASGRLFSRSDLTGDTFDLGKGTRDRPSSVRSAGR
jgi:hypothetical protein